MSNSAEDFTEPRRQMVEEQLESRRILDCRVLEAMSIVPREVFVPARLRSQAYEDHALPIECGQTISQPYTVAFMCQALRLTGVEKVLEVGTGSGYSAAVLSRLAPEIISVERIPELATGAKSRLADLGYKNVQVQLSDGSLGWPASAPYDAIVVTAAAQELPRAYFEQLKEGGRIVIPIGPQNGRQTMFRLTRIGDQMRSEDLGPFSFVPLISANSFPVN